MSTPGQLDDAKKLDESLNPPAADATSLLAQQVALLQAKVEQLEQKQHATAYHYYASPLQQQNLVDEDHFQPEGAPAAYVKRMIEDVNLLDDKERLNTSSYVNVTFEQEEMDVLIMGAKINLADQTVYPASFSLHDQVVNKLANLWHCPPPPAPKTDPSAAAGAVRVQHAGAGCVGSTEACLLAGLALKFRWRAWYQERHGLSEEEVRGVYPNLVISTLYQACWEKFFRYFDVEPRFVAPQMSGEKGMVVGGEDMCAQVDERTIGVVAILGNHYAGQYDPVWEIDAAVGAMNAEKGYQVGVHVDAASGGFVAPFQPEVPAWDFRLPNVLSISTSGHKFGQGCCGTGWVVWRQREDLSAHVAVSVTYLGGKGDSYTLNFSRPASGVYVQAYKIARLGMAGYQQLCDNMMTAARTIREGLKAMTMVPKAKAGTRVRTEGESEGEGGDGGKKGERIPLPLFVMLDAGNTACLPVVAAMLNPALNLPYDDIDLQYALAAEKWYVSAYRVGFDHPLTHTTIPLFRDRYGGGMGGEGAEAVAEAVSEPDPSQTMFRVVVKANNGGYLAAKLLEAFGKAVGKLEGDAMGEGSGGMRCPLKGAWSKASDRFACC